MKKIELWVGTFVLFGIFSSLFMIFEVANISGLRKSEFYTLTANFDNIGNLKLRSPVKVGGVVVGRVENIELNPATHIPEVSISIENKFGYFSETSTASILTAGLIGEQYIGIRPGFIFEDEELLTDGMEIEDTKSAIVLEDLIGQFLYSVGGEDE